MKCGTSYTCGARPTCFIMFCAMRHRLCLVRVHPELTNVFFFLLVSCCIELRTSCGGCTMRLRQTTCKRHLQPSRRTEQRLQRRRRRRPRVCCAGPCDGCPATAPSGSASSTPVRVSAASPSRASFHQASRRHHLVPVS